MESFTFSSLSQNWGTENDKSRTETYLKESVGFPDSSLVGRARCKITRPIGVWIVRVREKIIRLRWPRPASGLLVDSLDVTAWRRVKQVDSVAELVGILNHLVHILEIHVSFLMHQKIKHLS